MAQEDIHIAKKMLMDYITEKKLRMIPKRFIILEYIYSYEDGHFSVDAMYDYICKQGGKISRATLYNTIDLLLDAAVIIRHQFLYTVSAIYEKSVNKKFHHHYMCTKCLRIQDLRDDGQIKTAIQTRRIAKFKQTSFSLCIYGICSACSKE